MIPTTTTPTSNSPVNFSSLKNEAQASLLKLLDKFDGTKTIVWDDKLIGAFEFVAGASLLRKHEATLLVRLSDFKLSFATNTDYTLFFLRKDYKVAKFVSDILLRADKDVLAKISLVLVPQRCASIEKLLMQNKVDLDKLNSIEELPIELFVLDTDILSMENEFAYRNIYLKEDYSIIHQIVEGLVKLQDIYGQIPRISGQGKAAKLVCDLLLKRRKFQAQPSDKTPQISQIILIDRRIDLITPLLTQLTYEGLLDEVFGINHGTITLTSEKFAQNDEKKPTKPAEQRQPVDKAKTTRKFELRSTEELYARLRDCHTNAVADALKQSARNLQLEYDECKSENKTIHEMGKIVKRLNHLKNAKNSQSNHVTIAELVHEKTLKPEFIYGLRIEHELLQEERNNRVIPDIEMKLLRQENPLHILRLICLQSMINNGIRGKICDHYKREIIQNYGESYLLFLMELEKAKLLLSSEKYYESGTFSQLRSKFNLINDSIDECNPNHLSYVYGGYSPISVVVAKTLAQFTQPRSLQESLKLLPEPTVTYLDSTQSSVSETSSNLASSAVAAASSLLTSSSASTVSAEETRTILVFFIGGCTFAEISALRFLSQQEENNWEFIVGTTKIINGRTFLKSLWPQQVTTSTSVSINS